MRDTELYRAHLGTGVALDGGDASSWTSEARAGGRPGGRRAGSLRLPGVREGVRSATTVGRGGGGTSTPASSRPGSSADVPADRLRSPWGEADPASRGRSRGRKFTVLFERLAIDLLWECCGDRGDATCCAISWDEAWGIEDPRRARGGWPGARRRSCPSRRGREGHPQGTPLARRWWSTWTPAPLRPCSIATGDLKRSSLEAYYRSGSPRKRVGHDPGDRHGHVGAIYPGHPRLRARRRAKKIVFDKYHVVKHLPRRRRPGAAGRAPGVASGRATTGCTGTKYLWLDAAART